MASPIYFDAAAAELPHPMLAQWYSQLCRELPYNPHGGTVYAEMAKREILAAEDSIRQIVGAEDASILWTSGVTEALNLAMHSLGEIQVMPGSHPALAEPAAKLKHTAANHRKAWATSHVNSETGGIRDLESLRKEIGNGILLVDAAQSFCKIPIPWKAASIDLLVLSPRKIGGPASVGALLVRRGLAIQPMMYGGGQQNGLRPGTMDAIGISLFAKVARERAAGMAENEAHIRQLNDLLWKGLEENSIEYARISPEDAYPGIAMFALPGHEGAVLARILADKEGILLSSASACTAESGAPSKSLIEVTGSEALARSALRVSITPRNNKDEISLLITALKRTLDNY